VPRTLLFFFQLRRVEPEKAAQVFFQAFFHIAGILKESNRESLAGVGTSHYSAKGNRFVSQTKFEI